MTQFDPASACVARSAARSAPAASSKLFHDGPPSAGRTGAGAAKLSDLLCSRPLASPRLGTLMIVNGLTEEAEPLMRAGVEVANRLGAHLLCLSYSPYAGGETAGSAERRAVRRLLESDGERFEAVSASVRGGRTWLSSARALLPSLSTLSWWADLLMLNADELGEGQGAWRRLSVLSHALKTPILVRPAGGETPECDSVVLVSEASAVSQESIRRALPLVLKARHVLILTNDRSGDILKSGLLARGMKASCLEIERTGALERAETILAHEAGHVVVHGGAFAKRVRFAFGAHRRPTVAEHQSALLV